MELLLVLKKYANQFYWYEKCAKLYHKHIVEKDPKKEMDRCYYLAFGKHPNLDNPHDLIEKIFWLELYSDTSLWSKCADKYRVREYVASLGLSSYLPSLLGKWDNADEINLENLPNQFILKTNNGCATNYIVKNKEAEDIKKIKKKFRHWLSLQIGYTGGELHYSSIKPCVIAEELLIPSDEDKTISPGSLIDYKVWCFKGRPECVFVAFNRSGLHINQALYDLDWNPIPEHLVDSYDDKYDPQKQVPKPECLDEMLDIASKLSLPFPEVRCDFYVINNRPVIGEMTFSSGYGYFTTDYYNYLGDKVDINYRYKNDKI